ncbi:helicase-related protein [Halomonas getboli]|uniref:helicase-related protein n=1 Tax=Halomonas getboli TaxID=2935862 RepID=UPI0020003A31|nr:helicase-related protein [Halomonas getboli]MCK2183595.1 SNF2-related protein [Halomonas getboli]
MSIPTKTPVLGARASITIPSGEEETCRVLQSVTGGNTPRSQVKLKSRKEPLWVETSSLRSGYKSGMHVQATGSREARKFGEGIIVQTKLESHLHLHLTEFPESQTRRWLPWYVLKPCPSVKQRFLVGHQDSFSTAERCRLRILARLFQNWQQNTGALSDLDIDPLPHQIHLVHHILNSGNYNWLIADDVGLGKTIEAGMLIYALRQRKEARRVLIITPSGLTTQWQEEMSNRFNLRDFRIYGRDFVIQKASHWQDHAHDYVIGSMDLFKQDHHREMLLHAAPWDIVLVDEAHRLSRRQYGMKLDSSDRFNLLHALRENEKADNLILLTATPHQGMQDKFIALLELLRPELKEEFRLLDLNRSLLGEMVIRNYKSDVTDKKGNFIFRGKKTHSITVESSQESHDFDRSMQSYLKLGYSAGENLGKTGNAIGFVMTVYRKLAASSVAAIHQALINRLHRLDNEKGNSFDIAQKKEDSRYQGEEEEAQVALLPGNEEEFFSGERELLEELISSAERLKEKDLKLNSLMDTIIHKILNNSPGERILIFTEYRATQKYLKTALREKFGPDTVQLIHGGMSLDERSEAIHSFQNLGQFLISTEAGGEGINLHHNCHIMINYDLPWNPMRLVQRIGRLYRYGQKEPVTVLNINSKGSLDDDIITIMYERLHQVVEDMAQVQGDEFNEGLKDDILGEISDIANLEDIINNSRQQNIQRTQERIEEALERARNAASLQRDLFEHVSSFDANAFSQQIVVTNDHLKSFVSGMCRLLEIEVDYHYLRGAAWRLRLPQWIKNRLHMSRSVISITFNRPLSRDRDDLELISYGSAFFKALIEMALDTDFGGKHAMTSMNTTQAQGAILATMLRWQNEAGRRMSEEFSIFLDDGKDIKLNPPSIQEWLLDEATDEAYEPRDMEMAKQTYERLKKHCSWRMSHHSRTSLLPERFDPVSAMWVLNNP